jgi:hypothetical protein
MNPFERDRRSNNRTAWLVLAEVIVFAAVCVIAVALIDMAIK